MSESAVDGTDEGHAPEAVDAPASRETVIRLLPLAKTRETSTGKGLQDVHAADEAAVLRVEQLSKEVGWLLITAGVVGFVMPGILGTPFLIAGAFVVVPGGPKLLSRWAGRNPPKFVHSAMRQIGRFLDDLERRYPRK